jgi:TPR repeat protein
LYSKGRGLPHDDKEAVFWFGKAAEQDFPMAQYNLGFMYMSGRGVPQNDIEAITWFKKAAKQGVPEAQNYLGVFYQNGRGVPQNYIKAVKWYQKSADQGNALGQTNLGSMYYYGLGVTQDDYEAAKWWKKGAEQGYEMAKHNLDFMRKQGRLPELATISPFSPERIFEKIKPSIVVIFASSEGEKLNSLGSGVVIEKEGVITNCHVLKDGRKIQVRQDENTYNAALKYADFDRDLCQLNVPGLKSPSVIRGTAKDLKIGAHVYAIGSPEGLELSLSEGLVSGLREYEGTLFIQMTCSPER